MPDTYVYSGDPGLAALLANGAAFNVVLRAQQQLRFVSGEDVLGVIGAVGNDRGRPNECVELEGGFDDLRRLYGGWDSDLGDGAASGYEGNLYARSKGLDAPRIVLQPVDLALKDKTITDVTAVDVKVSLARGSQAFTTTIATDLINAADHEYANGDQLQIVSVATTTGITAGSTYFARDVVAGVSLKVALTSGGSAIDLATGDGSGVLRPIALAAPDFDTLTLPAGTLLQATGGGFIVRTLEDAVWAEDEFAAKALRVAKVSGTVAAMNTVDEFVSTPTDATLVVCTTITTVPDDVDAAELILRYQRAFDTILDSPLGQAMTVVVSDRDESAIGDSLSDHCLTARGRGYFRRGVVSPPNGTSATLAKATSGDGVGRATLTPSMVAYVHPGVRRSFLDDSANLQSPTYLATIPGAIAYAARIANTPAEQNPSRFHQVLRQYGIVAVEPLNPSLTPVQHFKAGIVVPEMVQQGAQIVPSFRDGIFADGTKIADGRLTDFLAANILAVLASYHKEPGSISNRETAQDAVALYLQSLVTAQRIAGFAVALLWDADNDHLRVKGAVDKTGNMDVITLDLLVGGDAVSESGIGIAA